MDLYEYQVLGKLQQQQQQQNRLYIYLNGMRSNSVKMCIGFMGK